MTDLDAYLDEQLDAVASEEFAGRVASSPELMKAIELQERIDECINRMYDPPPPPDVLSLILSNESDAVSDSENEKVAPHRAATPTWRVALYAIAACIAWIAVAGQFFMQPEVRVVAYKERPLAEVYHTCVIEGFEPYWVCEDDLLFAATFERRQGVRLNLADMPEGTEMVGLAYLAGLSRDSTSLLARVDGEPVLVVVDKPERDWGPETGAFSDGRINVHKTEKLGLVFYEITPFEAPRVTRYFVEAKHVQSAE